MFHVWLYNIILWYVLLYWTNGMDSSWKCHRAWYSIFPNLSKGRIYTCMISQHVSYNWKSHTALQPIFPNLSKSKYSYGNSYFLPSVPVEKQETAMASFQEDYVVCRSSDRSYKAKNSKILSMHSAVQTAVVTVVSYKPLSGLNFARCTEQYGSYMPSSPLGSISPCAYTTLAVAGL